MDQAALVDHQIDDAPKLLDQLKRDGFDVKAAFWLYTSEADQWFLYIVSDVVDQVGARASYKIVYESMRQFTDLWINPFEVKLVGPDHPIAKEVITFQKKSHSHIPTRMRGSRLGEVHIESAIIYPA
jgi:hypothetical protein